ncbi:MAG: 3-deoxy-manno-octulosonate cytidylyltransferase [Bacteroidetes bacterium]|nr:3-deoxy-manno-octulosonate cytidylyltransferase [Bacteroidota bacterium]
MKVIGIIPARYASSRLEGKPLIEVNGKSMIQRVYEQALKSSLVDKVIVATDDERIFDKVKSFGGEVSMTSSVHQSGTDRCAEVAKNYPQFDFVVNIQGDEPFIDPNQIDEVIGPLLNKPEIQITTLAKKIDDSTSLFDPNIVKVVFNKNQSALYFSRNSIPFIRKLKKEEWVNKASFYKHIGLYGFKKEVLLQVTALAPSFLEQQESLEQLRWLENGYPVYVGITLIESIGIDTPEDVIKARDWGRHHY